MSDCLIASLQIYDFHIQICWFNLITRKGLQDVVEQNLCFKGGFMF